MGDELREVLKGLSLRERLRRIRAGLRAPRGSPERGYARYLLLRVFGPSTITLLFCVGAVLALAVIGIAHQVAVTRADRDVYIPLPPANPDIIDPPPAGLPTTGGVDGREAGLAAGGPVAPDVPPGPGTPAASDVGPDVLPPPLPAVTPPSRNVPVCRIFPRNLGNRTAGGQAAIAQKEGLSPQTIKAINRSLEWLKAHQDADGSWAGAEPGDVCRTRAMAGLALLTFLAHGETQDSARYGETVQKALRYLMEAQAPDGHFVDSARASGGAPYAHAICTYAICEGLAMTRIVALQDTMNRGIQVIIDGQQPDGGFDYGYRRGTRFDLSVSAWQFQALKAARIAGCTNPRLDAAIRQCVRFLRTQAFSPAAGGFVYTGTPGVQASGNASWTMTGAGVLGLELLSGQLRMPEVRAGLQTLEPVTVRWDTGRRGAGGTKPALYGWYYVTQAKYHAGGPDWTAWKDAFQKEFDAAQGADGHWDNGDHGGPVYTTCLASLTLQVFWRYLPTYQQVHEEAAEKPAPRDENDPGIRVL